MNKQPGLYVTGTPIGNIGDMTERAKWVLGNADIIACEDKRVTGQLMEHCAIKRSGELLTYNDHSDDPVIQQITSAIQDGKMVALVSDAGMPLISDPGYRIVKACRDKDISVFSVPGPSSVSAALSISGLPSDTYHFYGFLPTKSGSKQEILSQAIAIGGTAIFFESAKRVTKTLEDLTHINADIETVVAREITKKFEEVIFGSAQDVLNALNDHDNMKGEIVLLIHTPKDNSASSDDHTIEKAVVLAEKLGISSKDIAKVLSVLTDKSKNEIYDMTLNKEDK